MDSELIASPPQLPILLHDEHLVAINKPHGLLVHRSFIASDVQEFAIQILREQIQQRVYPAHRLDRKTAGVLLFALNKESLVHLSKQFMEGGVEKSYLCVVRGYTPAKETINYPLMNDAGKLQDAITHYETLGQGEIPYPLGKHATQRYSLVLAKPETGRMHQLRKHFSHIFHPIIADRPGGCNKQNRFFKETFAMDTMLLHAHRLTFTHPVSGQRVSITAPVSSEFQRMLVTLQLKAAFDSFILGETDIKKEPTL